MSKALSAFIEAIWGKKAGWFGKFYIKYDKDKNISYGCTSYAAWESTKPVITIYWSKDLVVLSDRSVNDQAMFNLLSQLLPRGIFLTKIKRQWVLKDSEGKLFAWTGSQSFSISKHFYIYDSPQAVLKVDNKHWYATTTRPIKVVTVAKYGRTEYCVNTYELYRYWRESHWGIPSQWVIYWSHADDIAGPCSTKEEAELIAQRYSVEHQIPYVEYGVLEKRDVNVKFL